MDRLLPTPLALAAALILAVMLVIAAVAKLRDPDATAEDFAGLGLPWPGPLATLVPLTELACAALLVLIPGWGGVASFALLAAFTAILASVIRSGRVVRCACFGASDAHPVSSRHLLRNALLGLLALAAATVAEPIWSLEVF